MRRAPFFVTFIAICALFTGCEVTSRFDCSSKPCPSGQRCSAQYKLCVADEGPEVTVSSPVSMAVVSGKALKVEGSVVDDSEGAVTLTISSDGSSFAPVEVDATGHFGVELPLGTMDHALFTVTLKATDAAGISSNTEVAVHVDNVSPHCALISPSDAGFLNGSGNTVFRIQFDDGSPSLSQQQLTVDQLPLTATLADGVVSAVWTGAPAQNGVTHTMRYVLADAAGNTCEGQGSFLLDNVPPVLAVTYPMANALLGSEWFAATPWVLGPAATDQSNPAPTVTVDWDDGSGSKPVTAVDGGYRFVVSKQAEDFKQHQVKVTATDWAGNTTQVVVPVTVDTVAPRISFISPTPNARFNAASFQGTNDVTVNFDVQDGDDKTAVSAGIGSAPFNPVNGGSLKVPTSASDNPKPYQVKLHAVDQAGNSSDKVLDFSVDRVAPTVVSTTPANNTRNFDYATDVSVVFSEPMDTGVQAIAGVGTGSWTTGKNQWNWVPAADTVYNFTVAPIADEHGNVVANQPAFRFITAPFRPAAGKILDNIGSFEAAADQDGALTLVAITRDGNASWGKFDSKTGQFETLWTREAPGIAFDGRAYAWRNIRSDFSAQRLSGSSVQTNVVPLEKFIGFWHMDGVIHGGTGVTAIVPIPPLTTETATDLAGQIVSGAYSRAGRSPIPLGVSANMVAYTTNRFEAVEVNPPNITTQNYQCHKTGFDMPTTCDLDNPEVIATDALGGLLQDLQVVATPGCTVFSYETGMQRKSRFVRRGVCSTGFCTTSFTESSVGTYVKYAPTFVGEGLVRALLFGSTIMLSTRDCYDNGTWTNVGAPVIAQSNIETLQPIVSGSKIGVLYVDGGAQLILKWFN